MQGKLNCRIQAGEMANVVEGQVLGVLRGKMKLGYQDARVPVGES